MSVQEARANQATALLNALTKQGLNLTLPNGQQMGQAEALDVLASIENPEKLKYVTMVMNWAIEAGQECELFPKSLWEQARAAQATSLSYLDWVLFNFKNLTCPSLHTLVGALVEVNTFDFYLQVAGNVMDMGMNVPVESSVRVFTSQGEETRWNMEVNLSDRWGDVNDYRLQYKPGFVAVMMAGPRNLDLLLNATADEMTFLGSRDGKLGLFVEMEFQTMETETHVHGAGSAELESLGLMTDAEALPLLKKAIADSKAHEVFEGVEFALANDDDYCPTDRHGVLAFIPLEVLKTKENPHEFTAKVAEFLCNNFNSVTPELASAS